MNRYRSFILVLLVLALVQLACSMPVVGSQSATPIAQSSPTFAFPTLGATATSGPLVITATPDSVQQPTATTQPAATQAVQPTATTASSGNNTGNNNTGACTYRATFVADVTIPDDSVIPAGSTFTKTWRVRNDGTCTWGPNAKLHALSFTGGSKLNGPDQVSLSGNVVSGQTFDISVNLTAPTTDGVYTSEWKFRVDGDPNFNGTYLGMGAGGTQPLFTRIKVGATTQPTKTPTATSVPTTTTRLTFAEGGTAAVSNGTLKANQTLSFLVAASRGQTLMTGLSASGDAKITLASKDGSVLKVYSSADGKTANAWLPVTGDYIVSIRGTQETTYSLIVTVPARINFDAGAYGATVNGKISNKLPNTYFLKAGKDQTMTISVISSGNVVGLTIYGLQDGQVLVNAASGATSFSGTLPATQDYVIVAVPSADTISYTIDVTVK